MSQSIVTGTLTSATAGASVPLYAYAKVSIWGTFVGTVKLETSHDGGTTWYPAPKDWTGAVDLGTTGVTAPASVVQGDPEMGALYRVRCTAYTSGTINWRIYATDGIM